MIWMINAPFIFSAAWRIVSPLLEERSRKKIKFVSCDEHRCSSFLKDSVSPDVLPRCYGGRASMIPIESAAHQIFHRGIQHPNQLKAPSATRRFSEERLTWNEWLKRHKKCMKVAKWVTNCYKTMVHNRFNRYLCTEVKKIIWRPRESAEICIPSLSTKPPGVLTACFHSEQRFMWVVSCFLWLILLDIVLILVGMLRDKWF